MIMPSLSSDVLIVGGARGPLGGQCPILCGNPLFPYEQFVEVTANSVRFGYRAIGPGALHLQATNGATAYASYTLSRNGQLNTIDGDGERTSDFCRE